MFRSVGASRRSIRAPFEVDARVERYFEASKNEIFARRVSCARRKRSWSRSNKRWTSIPRSGEDDGVEGSKDDVKPSEGSNNSLSLSKESIETLRNEVFGFDTYFVTSYEEYPGGGVLFKGNLRGEADVTYKKLNDRMKASLGEGYTLFLLLDKENKPTVVVYPNEVLEDGEGVLPESVSCIVFAACTLATTLNSSGLPLPLLGGGLEDATLLSVLPGSITLLLLYVAHEIGHWRAAAKLGAEISLPFLVPLQQLGSLGSITRIKSVLASREQLFEISIAGPLYGYVASFAVLMTGFLLSKVTGQGIPVQAIEFQDSFLVGALGSALFGAQLEAGQPVLLHPLAIAGWAGMVINAINTIPVGETDGGRLAFSALGRQRFSWVSNGSLLLLGLGGIFSDLALYWFLFVTFLQRSPIKPQRNEVTGLAKPQELQAAGIFVLSLLMLLPFPFLSSTAVSSSALAGM